MWDRTTSNMAVSGHRITKGLTWQVSSYLVQSRSRAKFVRCQVILVAFYHLEGARWRHQPEVPLFVTNATVAFGGRFDLWQLGFVDESSAVAVAAVRLGGGFGVCHCGCDRLL